LGATISIELNDAYLGQRITWLETVLTSFHEQSDNLEDQVRELIPKIMGIYIQRLEHLFMRISNVSAHDPTLKRLSAMVSLANRINGEQGRDPNAVPSPAASMMGQARQFS